MFDKSKNTKELNLVIEYIENVLCNEFPCESISIEYFIMAILEVDKCHANAILDNYLTKSSMDSLREIYSNFLREISDKNVIIFEKKRLNSEFEKIISLADIEREKLICQYLGTEHILLSMLNPANENFKLIEIFRNVGVDYYFLYNKCSEQINMVINKNNKVKKNDNKPRNIIIQQGDFPTSIIQQQFQQEVNVDYVANYTTNLNELAEQGKIDKLVGRERELKEIIQTLARRNKNNVIIVGKGGVGKTHIIKNLANMIVNGDVPTILQDKILVSLNVMALVSGTHFRGMLEERLRGLFEQLKTSKKYILFIDDMQNVVKTSSKDKDTDISNMLGDILSGGEVNVIGAMSFKNYKNGIEDNSSLSRLFQKIVIEPSSIEESKEILTSNKSYYEKYHNVKYNDEIIDEIVKLSKRYITEKCLPDSAFDVLDLCGAKTVFEDKEPKGIISARRRLSLIKQNKSESLEHGDFETYEKLTEEENQINLLLANFNRSGKRNIAPTIITTDDVREVISDISRIPINKISSNEISKLKNIDKVLKKGVIGQDEAIDSICKVIKRNKIGLGNNDKCGGVLLFLGGTGRGKTLISKKIAEEIYGDERYLVRFDMSEYSEKSTVSKLIGSSVGYVGYENGGQLTEAIKNKPYCVLLLDEIEKADKEVYNIFLQMFDEGRLTDNSGQVVNFKNVIVIMTSNVGASKASELSSGMGFVSDTNENEKSIIQKEMKRKFPPEFLNRIDQVVYFNELSNENLREIVKIELNKLNKRLNDIGYNCQWSDDIVDYIQSEAIKQKEYGARPIIRLIQDKIETNIVNTIIDNGIKNNNTIKITYNEYDKVMCEY